MVDDVELPAPLQRRMPDHGQETVRNLQRYRVRRENGDTEPCLDSLLDRLGALPRHGNIWHDTDAPQQRLRALPRAGAPLAEDERLSGQLSNLRQTVLQPSMRGRDHQHQLVRAVRPPAEPALFLRLPDDGQL